MLQSYGLEKVLAVQHADAIEVRVRLGDIGNCLHQADEPIEGTSDDRTDEEAMDKARPHVSMYIL